MVTPIRGITLIVREVNREMNKILRILGWIAGGIVGLVFIVFIVLKLIPDSTYKGWITDGVKSATGRELAFDGEFDLDIGTTVGLNATGISFANADWGSRPDLFSADQLDVRLRLLPLLRGVVDFSFLLENPDILMEKNDDGNGNWEFTTPAAEAETTDTSLADGEANGETSDEATSDEDTGGTPSLPIKPYIRNLEIKGLKFAFNDRVIVEQMDAGIEVFRMAVEEDDLVLELDADYQGISMALAGTLGNVDDIYNFTFAPLQLSGNINESATFSIAGSAGPLMPSSDLKLDLNITAELDSLVSLEPFLAGSGEEGAGLPDSGPWKLNIKAFADSGWPGPVSVNANLVVEEITANADATVRTSGGEMRANLNIALDAPSLAALGDVLGQTLPDRAPFTVRTMLSAQASEFALDELSIQIGDGQIIGSASYSMPAEGNPVIVARLDMNDVDLTPLPPEESTGEEGLQVEDESVEGHVQKDEPESTGAKLFSSEPIGTGSLRKIDADIKVNSTNLIYGEGSIPAAEMSLVLKDGLLTIDPLHLEGSGRGALDGKIEIDARESVAGLDIFIDANDFATPTGGSLDLDIDIDGHGDSVASVMGSLNGQLVFALTDLDIENSLISRMGTGLGNLNPFASRATTLECAVIRMDIENGVVDFEDKVVAMLTDSTIMGSGTVDLKTESLDAGVNVEPRKVSGSIVDLGLTGMVSVTGTLAEPRVRLNPSDVALKYASYSAYIATGGLSWLVEKAVGQVKANADVCGNVLKKGEEETSDEEK